MGVTKLLKFVGGSDGEEKKKYKRGRAGKVERKQIEQWQSNTNLRWRKKTVRKRRNSGMNNNRNKLPTPVIMRWCLMIELIEMRDKEKYKKFKEKEKEIEGGEGEW